MARTRNYHSLSFTVRMKMRRMRLRVLQSLIRMLEANTRPAV